MNFKTALFAVFLQYVLSVRFNLDVNQCFVSKW